MDKYPRTKILILFIMDKHYLLRVCRVQEIDIFFSYQGYSRNFIYKKIIYPNFYISRATYSNYLNVNAKFQLKKKYGIDWKEELSKHKPIDYTAYQEQIIKLRKMQLSIFDPEEFQKDTIK